MTDLQFMRRAFQLARRGEGRVEPNPMVGCVLARDGKILGEGHHGAYGGPHAEVEAIAACRRQGNDPAGATVYVTLEPCCHQGQTPPCTDALIQARPDRVVVAMIDPARHAAGAGIEALRQAAILVEIGTGGEAAKRLTEPYITRLTTGLPWVMAKWAQTIDGHIASRTGDSRWISTPRSRKFVHRLRGRVDAVIVGIGTVLADDPQLTARNVPVRRYARRVVIDPSLRIPDDAKLLLDLEPPLTMAIGSDADSKRAARLKDCGVELFEMPPGAGGHCGVDLRPLLQHLATAHGATNVLVEGGSRLLGALLSRDLVDQFLVFIAPVLMGDAEAITAIRGRIVAKVESATRLHLASIRHFDEDILLDYRREV